MPDVFDLDSRHPKYSKSPAEPEFIIVEVFGTKLEIVLAEDQQGFTATCEGHGSRYARTHQAAIEAMLETIQENLYTE